MYKYLVLLILNKTTWRRVAQDGRTMGTCVHAACCAVVTFAPYLDKLRFVLDLLNVGLKRAGCGDEVKLDLNQARLDARSRSSHSVGRISVIQYEALTA